MINIRKDLIQEELGDMNTYSQFNLNDIIIKKLHRHYTCIEISEYFYDLDPDVEENKRLESWNWVEIYRKGNWDMTQKYVDDGARCLLKNIKDSNISSQDRLYFSKTSNENEEYIKIYYYGRDYMNKDYWLIFKKM